MHTDRVARLECTIFEAADKPPDHCPGFSSADTDIIVVGIYPNLVHC